MLRTRQKVVRGTVSPLDVGRPDGDEVDLPAGEWGITAGGIGAVGTTTCTVVEARPGPSITIAPESGERNSTATVSGEGFGGKFRAEGAVPGELDGTYQVVATRHRNPGSRPRSRRPRVLAAGRLEHFGRRLVAVAGLRVVGLGTAPLPAIRSPPGVKG